MLAMFDDSTLYLAGPESISPYSEAHNMYAPVHADRGSFGHEYQARKSTYGGLLFAQFAGGIDTF